jgi:hypothetical protein
MPNPVRELVARLIPATREPLPAAPPLHTALGSVCPFCLASLPAADAVVCPECDSELAAPCGCGG